MILIVNHKDKTKRKIQLMPEYVLQSGRPGDKKKISFPALMNKLEETAQALAGDNYSSFKLLNYETD